MTSRNLAAYAASALIGTALTTLSLAFVRAVAWPWQQCKKLWIALGMRALVARAPYTVLLLTQAGALTLSHSISPWRYALLAPAVALLALVSEHLFMPPITFAGLRAHIAAHWPERLGEKVLAQPLDAYFLRRALDVSLMVLPPFVGVFLPGADPIVVGYLYVSVWLMSEQAFEILEHTNVHNRVFRTARDARPVARLVAHVVDLYVAYVLSFVCSRIPQWYHVQHVVVHHGENNGARDNQSTAWADRRSYFDFAVASLYWCLDWFLAPLILRTLASRGAKKPIVWLVGHMLGYYFLLAALWWLTGPVGVAVLTIVRVARAPLDVLNTYEWHAFCDPDAPAEVARNSVTVVPITQHGWFGGGQHLEHHLRPAAHWSTYVRVFSDGETKLHDAQAIVLTHTTSVELERQSIASLLIRRRYDLLARRVARMGDFAGSEAVARELERRSIPREPRPRLVMSRFDRAFGPLVARVLM